MKKTVYLFTVILASITAFSCCSCSADQKWFEGPVQPEVSDSGDTNKAVLEDAFAFPGAEGGGMNATGGRGGKVIKVTSLEDSNTLGTFRYAVSQSGPRIIIFEVAGTIFLKSSLTIRNDNITIAGQTAPGGGVAIAHFPVNVSANNVIIRYLRFRMGGEASGSDGDDALGGRQRSNIIIDHCSMSWSTDECCSFYDNQNFTMQWSIISESLRISGHSKGPHGYGGIWGGVNASFHHNLMAHHDSRTPRFGPGAVHAGTDKVDVRNNVYYNWSGNGCYGGEAMHINIVNNYYKAGPATGSRVANRVMQIDVSAGGGDFEKIKGIWGKYYITGNVFPNDNSVTENNWNGINIYQKEGLPQGTVENLSSTTPVEVDPCTTHDAYTAYEKVLAWAGCSKVRDIVDDRIVDETRNGTTTYYGLSPYNGYTDDYPGSDTNWKSRDYPKPGLIDSQDDLRPAGAAADWSAWPALDAGTVPADTDADGMPDSWENEKGLDSAKNDANERTLSTAYDNIEVYINSLVADITEATK